MDGFGEIVIRLYINTGIDNLAGWFSRRFNFIVLDSSQTPCEVSFSETDGSYSRRRMYHIRVEPETGLDVNYDDEFPDEEFEAEITDEGIFWDEGLITIDMIDDTSVLFVCRRYPDSIDEIFDQLFNNLMDDFFPDQVVSERIVKEDNKLNLNTVELSITNNKPEDSSTQLSLEEDNSSTIPAILTDPVLMQPFFRGGIKAKYNVQTAKTIYTNLPIAWKEHRRGAGKWGPGLIGRSILFSTHLTSTYLGAFVCAGIKTFKYEGQDIDIPHRFRKDKQPSQRQVSKSTAKK